MIHTNDRSRRGLILLLSVLLGCHLAGPTGHAREAKGKQEALISKLIDQLGDESFDKREAAQARLKEIAEPAAEALLQASKQHPDLEVRYRAGKLLVGLPVWRVMKLIDQLGDDAYQRRDAASRELVKIGKPAVGLLRKASIHSVDLEIRQRAKTAADAIEGK
jgi:HEAT repeat protein